MVIASDNNKNNPNGAKRLLSCPEYATINSQNPLIKTFSGIIITIDIEQFRLRE